MRKLLVLLCAAALCFSGTTGATGPIAPATAEWNPNKTAPMTNDVAVAAAYAHSIHCKTPSCKAIIVIHELIDIARFEYGDANGIASLYTGKRPEIAGNQLDRVLLNHPKLYGPVCTTGSKLISRFRLAPGIYEMDVPVQLLLSAVDMDLRNHGHCARDLLAALPKDLANNEVRSNAQSLCANGYENHSRPKAACHVLISGLATGQ